MHLFPPLIMRKIESGLPTTWLTHVNQLLIAWQENTHMSKNVRFLYKYLALFPTGTPSYKTLTICAVHNNAVKNMLQV